MTKTNSIKSLQRYIQNYYPHYLQENLVDIVETDKHGAVFGYPSGCGNSGYIRFIPYKNGQVGVQYGDYYERGERTEWYDIEKWPDVDCFMMLGEDFDPLDKPAKALTNYRKY